MTAWIQDPSRTAPAWGVLEVRVNDHASPCDNCGTPAKRLVLLEDLDNGTRLWVGYDCHRKLLAVSAA